eukprot:5327945-Alexandrium_andersonii.AAC.1
MGDVELQVLVIQSAKMGMFTWGTNWSKELASSLPILGILLPMLLCTKRRWSGREKALVGFPRS